MTFICRFDQSMLTAPWSTGTCRRRTQPQWTSTACSGGPWARGQPTRRTLSSGGWCWPSWPPASPTRWWWRRGTVTGPRSWPRPSSSWRRTSSSSPAPPSPEMWAVQSVLSLLSSLLSVRYLNYFLIYFADINSYFATAIFLLDVL